MSSSHPLTRSAAAAILVASTALFALAPSADGAASQRTGTASSSSRSCRGEALPAAPRGGTWVCTFDDEFDASTGDATALGSAWTPQVTATSGYLTGDASGAFACYEDSPSNISVSGGALHLTVERLPAPISCGGTITSQYTAGMVSTIYDFAQTYGHFEVRAKLPAATAEGLQETFWLWPEAQTYGDWPASGEIDFAEFYSQFPTVDIPVFHYGTSTDDTAATPAVNKTTAYCRIATGSYNTYGLTWQPGRLTVSVNGRTCLIDRYDAGGLSGAEPFDQPFFLVLTQALGMGTNALTSATPLPATTSVDWVRAWKNVLPSASVNTAAASGAVKLRCSADAHATARRRRNGAGRRVRRCG